MAGTWLITWSKADIMNWDFEKYLSEIKFVDTDRQGHITPVKPSTQLEF